MVVDVGCRGTLEGRRAGVETFESRYDGHIFYGMIKMTLGNWKWINQIYIVLNEGVMDGS